MKPWAIIYIEKGSFPLELNVRNSGGIKKNDAIPTIAPLPPQQHPVGDNQPTGEADYQEPDDDMASLKKPNWWDDWPEQEERPYEGYRIDWERANQYYEERDRRDYEAYEREYERDNYDPIEDFYEYASRSAYHS